MTSTGGGLPGAGLLAALDSALGGMGDPRQLGALAGACSALEAHMRELGPAARRFSYDSAGGVDGGGSEGSDSESGDAGGGGGELAWGQLADMLRWAPVLHVQPVVGVKRR